VPVCTPMGQIGGAWRNLANMTELAIFGWRCSLMSIYFDHLFIFVSITLLNG